MAEESFRVVRRFNLARAAVLARVTGFGKSIVSLFNLRLQGGLLATLPHAMKCLGENGRWSRCGGFENRFFHNGELRLVMKSVDAGPVAFFEQLRLGLQPMLHVVSRARTLVHVTEVCFSGNFVSRGRKIKRALGVIFCEFILFHTKIRDGVRLIVRASQNRRLRGALFDGGHCHIHDDR